MALQPITPHISDVDNFLTHCHRRRYPNRATIIYEGDSCDTLYYIISESVSVVLEDNDGKEVIVAYLNPGDFLGEMGLFEQTEDRSAWCRTRNQSEIAEISYANFNAYVHGHPEIVFTIGRQMATRLRNTTRKVGDLSFFDVTGRVVRTLIDLAKEPDAMTHPLGMQISITRQEIGRIVNWSRSQAKPLLYSALANGPF